MLEQELNATTEAQPNRGRLSWAKKNEKLLKGTALLGTAAGTGAIAGKLAVAAATLKPTPPNGFTAETLAHVKENVVTVYMEAVDANGIPIPGTKFMGSGFFIRDTQGQLVGTAEHVLTLSDAELEALNLPEGATWRYSVKPHEGELAGQLIEVKPPAPAALDAGNDLGIVDLGRTTSYTGLELAPDNSVQIADTVGAVGVPGYWSELGGTFKQLSVSTIRDNEFVLDGFIHHGFSGSVLFDTQGRVIGINTSAPIRPFGPDRDWDGTPDYYDELSFGIATRVEPFKALLEGYKESDAYRLLTTARTESTFINARYSHGDEEKFVDKPARAEEARPKESRHDDATDSDAHERAIDALADTGSNVPLVNKVAWGGALPQLSSDNRVHEQAFDLATATGGESSPIVVRTSAETARDLNAELTPWHHGNGELRAELLDPLGINPEVNPDIGPDAGSSSLWDHIAELLANAA